MRHTKLFITNYMKFMILITIYLYIIFNFFLIFKSTSDFFHSQFSLACLTRNLETVTHVHERGRRVHRMMRVPRGVPSSLKITVKVYSGIV